MRLVYVKWKELKAFLRILDKPTSTDFKLIITTHWQPPNIEGQMPRLVWHVEIPQEYIT